MTKFGDEVLRKYYDLEVALIDKIGDSPFPKTGDVDGVDIVSMIMNYFMNCEGDYYGRIKAFLPFTKVTEEQLEKVYPLIKEFLDWVIQTLQKI